MANFPTERLLGFTPYEGLLIQFNEVHGTSLTPRYIELVSVNGTSGPLATVTLRAKDTLPNKEEKRFSGHCTFQLQRLDLASLFPDGVSVILAEGLLSHDIARIVGERTGIVFDSSDFDDVLVTVDDPVLQASIHSLRWYGQLTINPI